jgi:Zn-dependent M28 family amino/carboxypeptidase
LKRSVVFALLTGEEKGLLGSKYYTEYPKVPLYKTIANINIDGVASFDKFKSIIIPGAEQSNISSMLAGVFEELNLKIYPDQDLYMQTEYFDRSDQIAFAQAGVPSTIIMDAPDYYNLSEEEGRMKFLDYSINYYHTPFDDLSQRIDYDAFLQHVQLICASVFHLCTSEEVPEWNSGSQYINARLRSIAEKK